MFWQTMSDINVPFSKVQFICSSHLLRPVTIPSVEEAEDENQTIMNMINFLHWDDEADLFPLKTQKPQEESRIWATPVPTPPWSGCDVLIWPLLDPTIGLPCHPLGSHPLGIILASLFNTSPHFFWLTISPGPFSPAFWHLYLLLWFLPQWKCWPRHLSRLALIFWPTLR